MATPKRRNKPEDDPDIILKTHNTLTSGVKKVGVGIQNRIIKSWMPKFEQKYINTLKKLDENQTDPKKLVDTIQKRIGTQDFTKPFMIVVQYSPTDKFSVLSTYTEKEIEYEEFLKWKKTKKK
jgi:hypothetical protein